MKHHLFLSFVAVASTLITGCATGRQIQFVDRIQRDTIYINKVHYDSIYISHDRTTDYHRGFQSNESAESVQSVSSVFSPPMPDTVFIHDRTVEYRYRLLRDTLYRTRIDSIPVIREVELIREVPRPKTWFDRLCRYAFFLLCGVLLFFVYRCIRKFI